MKWNKFSDRKPPEDVTVLAIMEEDTDGERYYDCIKLYDGDYYSDIDGRERDQEDALYWMFLPKMP